MAIIQLTLRPKRMGIVTFLNFKDKIVFSWLSSLLAKTLGWWNEATPGTRWTIFRRGKYVGSDSFGNRYFEARDKKDAYDKHKRRWVVYKGYADASKIPPEWHGWMHYIYDTPPSQQDLPRQSWERDHVPNMSGTPYATFPPGSLNAKASREKASGDYEAWKP